MHRNGTRWDDNGFRVDGHFRTTMNRRDPDGYNQQGFNRRGFNRTGGHENGTKYNERCFSHLGIHRDTNSEYDLEGYNQLGFNRRGFNSAGRLACNSEYDARGFDDQGRHLDTNTTFNPQGFGWDGTHRNGTKFSDDGLNIDGYNMAQVREREVGTACYIPGTNDARGDLRSIIQIPAGFASAEDFVVAIENKCREFQEPITKDNNESSENVRQRLIEEARNGLGIDGSAGVINYYDVNRENQANGVNNVLPRYLANLYGANLFKKVELVSFIGEAGIGGGGLTKEFRELVSEKLTPMFKASADGMMPDEGFANFGQCVAQGYDQTAQNCWTSIGRIIAKLAFVEGGAFKDNVEKFYYFAGLARLKLNSSVYHALLDLTLNTPVEQFALLKLADSEYFGHAMQVLKMSDDGISDLGLEDLENGDKINAANIYQFYQEQINAKFRPQEINWLKQGFSFLAPDLGSIDSMEKLKLVLQGSAVTLDGLIAALEFQGDAGPRRQWLEEIIREESTADPEFLSKLLRFWTGSSFLPATGKLKVFIYNPVIMYQNRLPESHTCFNRLDIPQYLTKKSFKEKLIMAIGGAQGMDNR